MDFAKTLEKIKERGYWTLNFYPTSISNSLIKDTATAKEVIRNASIQLRGWDYPHIPTDNIENQGMYAKNNSIEGWVNFEKFKEIWRLYLNGQFVHMFSLREDWFEEDSWISEDSIYKRIKRGELMDALGIVFSITEMYIFLFNLVSAGVYNEGINIELSFKNTSKRKLTIFDPMRAPLFHSYTCESNEIVLPLRQVQVENFSLSYLHYALEDIIFVFKQFNWDNPPIQTIKNDQIRLIERKL